MCKMCPKGVIIPTIANCKSFSELGTLQSHILLPLLIIVKANTIFMIHELIIIYYSG